MNMFETKFICALNIPGTDERRFNFGACSGKRTFAPGVTSALHDVYVLHKVRVDIGNNIRPKLQSGASPGPKMWGGHTWRARSASL